MEGGKREEIIFNEVHRKLKKKGYLYVNIEIDSVDLSDQIFRSSIIFLSTMVQKQV